MFRGDHSRLILLARQAKTQVRPHRTTTDR